MEFSHFDQAAISSASLCMSHPLNNATCMYMYMYVHEGPTIKVRYAAIPLAKKDARSKRSSDINQGVTRRITSASRYRGISCLTVSMAPVFSYKT